MSKIIHDTRPEDPSTILRQGGSPEPAGDSDVLMIGFLQFAPQVRSERENVKFICSAVQGVSDATIVLPEFFLGSYKNDRLFFLRQEDLINILGPLLAVSAKQRLRFVGSLPVHCEGRNFNRALLISEGNISTAHDKVRLFGPEIGVFSAGKSSYRLVDIAGLASTVQICMDISDPAPVRAAATAGVDLVLSPSTVSVDFLRVIHRARALENQVISVFCNRHGVDDDGTVYLGRSAIFFPDGSDVSASGGEDRLVLSAVRSEQLHVWSVLRSSLIGSMEQ